MNKNGVMSQSLVMTVNNKSRCNSSSQLDSTTTSSMTKSVNNMTHSLLGKVPTTGIHYHLIHEKEFHQETNMSNSLLGKRCNSSSQLDYTTTSSMTKSVNNMTHSLLGKILQESITTSAMKKSFINKPT